MTAEEAIYRINLMEADARRSSGLFISLAGRHIELEMAIEALEKQIPKKPTEVDEREVGWIAFMCPTCNTAVIGQPYRPNNCKHCGQKLDWSD